MELLEKSKLDGNTAFKNNDFQSAVQYYSSAIKLIATPINSNKATSPKKSMTAEQRDILTTLLSNRAACHLKLLNYNEAIIDCDGAIELNPTLLKAYYRKATAFEALKEYNKAFIELNELIHYEPANKEALLMIRRIKTILLEKKADSSDVSEALDNIKNDPTYLINGLKSLISLCYDDKYHAIEFGRRGLLMVCNLLNEKLGHISAIVVDNNIVTGHVESVEEQEVITMIRLLAAVSNHKEFVNSFIIINDDENANMYSNTNLVLMNNNEGKFYLTSLCGLNHIKNTNIIRNIMILLMTILRSVPFTIPDKSELYIQKNTSCSILKFFKYCLELEQSENYNLIIDSIAAFISESINYYDHDKLIDTRNESIEDRKLRFSKESLLKQRSINHTKWCIEMGFIDIFIHHLDNSNAIIRHNASVCIGKLLHIFDNDEDIKKIIIKRLVGAGDSIKIDENDSKVEELDIIIPSMELCRKRAAIEACLLVARPELGVWALKLPHGIQQLLLLVSSGDERCQEIASEVMCLTASTDSGSGLLATIVSSGALQTLLHSPHAGILAAAASTMTKLSLKAKAFKENSPEIALVLNTVHTILKGSQPSKNNNINNNDKNSYSNNNNNNLISFSVLDEVSLNQKKSNPNNSENSNSPKKKDNLYNQDNAIVMTSIERAVEVLAAMVGKTYIKEEIVHGSYRISSCMMDLTKLDIDERSSTAYGIAHILCALTVTNHELRLRALAEKDISPEQYDQMQELQRIKAQDEDGNSIEEPKNESDSDTQDLCKRRIKRIIHTDAIPMLVKFLSSQSSSNQTREASARALRQICVEETARGQVIQHGGLKACSLIAADPDLQ
eukprot:gene13443-18025_t